jgi:hypothetical protein
MSTKRTNEFKRYSKKRRLSKNVFLLWDNKLNIKDKLKKLRKYRLGITQIQFDHLQNQLYIIGCVIRKDDYYYPIIKSNDFHIPDSVYLQLFKHLKIRELYKLCIWKYANTKVAQPSAELQELFRNYELEEIRIQENGDELDIDIEKYEIHDVVETKITNELKERSVIKNTTIKINDEYTLQNVEWTVHQRKAARNTRDYFVNNRIEEKQYPMLSDIELRESNRTFVSQFLTALLKANVSASIISDICCNCFGASNRYFDLEEKVLLKEKILTKEKNDTPMQQRSSITDFSYMEKENKAACIIQRVFRQKLQQKRKAVQIIERFWFPYVIENEVEREVMQRRLTATLDTLDAQNEFKYDEFKEEIIEDFKTLNTVKNRGYMYWLKIYFFTVLGCSIEYVLNLLNVFRMGEEIMIVALWVLFQSLTLKRLNKIVIIIQTVVLIALTCRFLNVSMQVDTVAVRCMAYFIIVNVSRHYWLVGLLLAVIIRVALSFTNLEYSFIRPNEGFVFVYDIYSVVTIVACQRVGDPIEMLHKWMVGVLFFAVIASGVAAGHIVVLLGTEI